MVRHTHVGVYGVIIENEKILLIKKARGAYTGSYDLPGGKIEFGESPREALIREINEETGLEVKELDILDGISNHVEWKRMDNEIEDLHHLGFIFKAKVSENKNIKTESDGEDSLGSIWIKLNEVNNYELSPFARNIIHKIKD